MPLCALKPSDSIIGLSGFCCYGYLLITGVFVPGKSIFFYSDSLQGYAGYDNIPSNMHLPLILDSPITQCNIQNETPWNPYQDFYNLESGFQNGLSGDTDLPVSPFFIGDSPDQKIEPLIQGTSPLNS